MCYGNDHVFIYSGGEGVPEGLPCECGMVIAHWEKCPVCGQIRCMSIPNIQTATNRITTDNKQIEEL